MPAIQCWRPVAQAGPGRVGALRDAALTAVGAQGHGDRSHPAQPDATGLTGPNLLGVVGRAVASAPDFAYSSGLKVLPARGDPTWTKAALDALPTSPGDLAPGTAIAFVGMPSAKERADVIAYRASHAAGPE